MFDKYGKTTVSQDIPRHKSDTKAVIGLGSNVALSTLSSQQIVKSAFLSIEDESTRILEKSRLYRTPCVPEGAGPDYVNAAAILETSLGAQDLLDHLHSVEQAFDRRRESRWASRTLDLDLLDFGGALLPDLDVWRQWHDLPFEAQKSRFPEEMILPHPRIQDRAFVLVPLAEIAPDWRHPVLDRSAADMLADLTADQLDGISAV